MKRGTCRHGLAQRRCLPGAALALTIGVVAAAPSVAGTANSANAPESSQVRAVRQQVINADLSPKPLYPTRLSEKLACCGATFTRRHGGRFYVLFTKPKGEAPPSGYRRLADYSRTGKDGLRKFKKLARAQGHPIHRLRINGWKVFYAKTDIVFYFAWHAQGYTYATTSHYLGGMKPHDLRTLVASARQVPSTSGIHRGELQASRTPVYVRASAAGDERFKVHPRTLQIVATGQFRKLNWRDWGSGRTSSPGRYVYSAGGGNIKRSRGNVRLSRIRQCDGRDVYTRLRWRARGVENGRWLSGQFYPSDCSVTA